MLLYTRKLKGMLQFINARHSNFLVICFCILQYSIGLGSFNSKLFLRVGFLGLFSGGLLYTMTLLGKLGLLNYVLCNYFVRLRSGLTLLRKL
jgi:hypothetical protein